MAAIAIAVGTFIAYGSALMGGFVWDDDAYVTANQALRDVGGLLRIWLVPGTVPQYYPLTFTTLWAEYQLFGSTPFPYHLTNVVLHAVSAVLLGVILRRLAVPGAWLAAALFALHPVQVESVAWVTERKNVLATVLYLAAAYCYLRFDDEHDAPARDRTTPAMRRTFYALAFVLFLGALLSKTVTCTLPVAMLIVRWWRRGRVTVRDATPLVPFFAVGVALGLFTVWMERHHVGATGVDWQLSMIDRVLIAGRALWFYLRSLLWPFQLTFIYPRWRIDAGAWWQYLFPIAAVMVAVVVYAARGRLGRGPAAALAFFAVTLFPALGFFDVYPMRYAFVADHFQYLATIGPLTLIAALATVAARRVARSRQTEATAAAVVVLAFLGVLTWRQSRAYESEETLWRDTIRKNPAASMAHLNLGMLLQRDGRLDEAIANYRQVLAIDGDVADAHKNLGNALIERGQVPAAIEHYEAALRASPNDAGTHVNLGNAFAGTGAFDRARAEYARALALRPDYPDAHANLGTALAREGRVAEAIERLGEAVRLDPGYVQARLNLAHLLADSGNARAAASQYSETLRMSPGSIPALTGLAWVLATAADATVRDGARAVGLAERAAQGAGSDAFVLDALAAAYAEAGRFEDARAVAERAVDAAERGGDATVAAAVRGRLDGYRAGRPHRASASGSVSASAD